MGAARSIAHDDMGWNEARLLDWIATWERPAVLAGSRGHDAAVLAPRAGRMVVCADQVALGVHAALDVAPARFGAKAIARTVSDLAATAAQPYATLVTVRAPAAFDERWLKAALKGAVRRAHELGAPIVGGDLCAADGAPSFSCTALGVFASRRTPPGRDRARVGQVVVATGAFGGSLLGRHLAIEPRVAAGRALFAAGATALMDVSDGLGLDLSRLARASGVRIVLDHVPVHRDAKRRARTTGRAALDHALEDGEDHELLATLPAARARELLARGLDGCPAACVIGRVERGSGLELALAARTGAWRGRGFVHGQVGHGQVGHGQVEHSEARR
jgi:thiamine-monophosphate kinase